MNSVAKPTTVQQRADASLEFVILARGALHPAADGISGLEVEWHSDALQRGCGNMMAGISTRRVDRLRSTLHELSWCKHMDPIVIEWPVQIIRGALVEFRCQSAFGRNLP